MSKQKTVRTNKAYTVDNPIEALVLTFRAIRWCVRLAWRYRTELGFFALVLVLYRVARMHLNADWSGIALGSLVAFLLAWGTIRRFVFGRLMCSHTRRQLRAVFLETRIANGAGKLPAFVRSRSTASGERITLRCRAGQSAEQIETRMEELRAATRSRTVNVVRNSNRSHLVVLEVVRREVLAGLQIDSPLVRYASFITANASTVGSE